MIELSNLLSHRQIRSARRDSPKRVTGPRAAALLAAIGAVTLLPLGAQAAEAAVPGTAPVQGRPQILPADDGQDQEAAGASARQRSVWDDLAMCESSGDWHIDSGNGFFGGLQFWQPTWRSFGGQEYAPRADLATRLQQIDIAREVLEDQGWQAWPVCSRRVGAADRDPGTEDGDAADRDADGESAEHAVLPGETLGGIAQAYDVDGGWQRMYALNQDAIGPDPDFLTPGTVLAVPR